MRRLIALFLVLLLAALPLSALAEADEIVKTISDFLESVLDAGNYTYSMNDVGYYVLAYESSSGELGDIYAFLDVYASGVLIYACYADDVPPEYADEITKFINLVNGLVSGTKYYILPDSGAIFYELPFFLDVEHLGDYEADMVLEMLDSVVADIDYDTDYFMEIIGGETAKNVFAMFQADYNHE